MTKKEEFLKANHDCYAFNGMSATECIQRIKLLFDIWQGMRKNAREATKNTMDLAVENCLNQIIYQLMYYDDEELSFKEIREKIPDMDELFRKLDKKFPGKMILYKLSQCGYIKP